MITGDHRIGSNPAIASAASRGARCTRFGLVTWDAAPPDPWVLEMLVSRAKWAVLWGGNYYPRMDRATCWLVWDKRVPNGGGAHAELAWTNLRRAVRMFRWRWSGMLQEDMKHKEQRVHPNQKPVALMSWCISKAPGVRTVLDPFAGAGSTLLAARQAGLSAVGIEQDKRYCDMAVKRLLEAHAAGTTDAPAPSSGRCTPSGRRTISPPIRPAAPRDRVPGR